MAAGQTGRRSGTDPGAGRDDDLLALPVDGWSLAYEHQPDMEWDTHSSWTDPTNRELLSEAREVYERGPNLERYLRRPQRPRLVGRNEPCVCGSGRKYKHCHGRPELGA